MDEASPFSASDDAISYIDSPAPISAEALEAGRLILLVEDNAVNQKIAILLLNRLGYAVRTVENGLLAVKAMKTLPYALVLMDCQMPVMDGFEATQTIRRNELKSGRYTPIIAMTANAMQGDRENCLAAGMDDYLTKPIDPQTLHQALKRWLPNVNNIVVDLAPTKHSASNVVATATEPVEPINMLRLKEIFKDDIEMRKKFLKLFIDTTTPLFDNIKIALDNANHDAVRRLGHEIKGSAANFGLSEFQYIGLTLEQNSTDTVQATELLTKMPEAMQRVQQYLDTLQ
jgi:two-component system, sensor histidine kinase and response regulator